MTRPRVFTKSPWEDKVGYCRAVNAGGFVFVSGTTSVDPDSGHVMHAGNMGRQAALAFSNVARALERLGSSTANVVRVRMYVTDIARFDEVAVLHKQFFGQEPPAATVVEVSALAHPDLMFEVEVTALAPS